MAEFGQDEAELEAGGSGLGNKCSGIRDVALGHESFSASWISSNSAPQTGWEQHPPELMGLQVRRQTGTWKDAQCH